MNLARRGFLGLVMGLPFALKGAADAALSPVESDHARFMRILREKQSALSYAICNPPSETHWLQRQPDGTTFMGVPVLYRFAMDEQ